MLDWLVAWGVSSAVGFAFKEVLAPLAKGALEDYTKDFFKERIKDFTGLFEQDTLPKVTGKALKEFLALVQEKLEEADVPEEDLPKYVKPLKQFITNQKVRGILGGAFAENGHHSHYSALPIIWQELNLLALPDGFSWELVAKLYLKKVKALIRESDELREIFDSQNLAAIAENTRELAGIIPAFDLRQYQEGIREKYGNLRLDSLDTDGAAYNRLKLWRIFIPQNVRFVHGLLPQVYELPKEHLRRMRDSNDIEGDIEELDLEKYRRVYGEQLIRSVLDIINDKPNYRYLVILGDPGAGKSSLLQYLALNWANSPLNNVISLPIPLLIELRTYMRNRDNGDCHNFLEFFHQSSGAISHLNQHQLQEQLKTGKVLVMFDGLDEVFDPGKREDVITDIHRFTNEYPNVQVIVTSRVIGYKPQRLRDAEFHHFMLQDLDEKQIEDFLYRWHELTFTDEADKLRKRERLQRAIDTSKAIKELAGNPLLLTMMAILNRNQELPRDRAELYNQSSRLLLQQWDVERLLIEDARLDPNTIDYKDKQAILRQVAYQMQGHTKGLAGNLISATDLERIITDYLKTIEVSQPRTLARVLINQLRSRNFILCYLGADYYAFVHRTFLEYFCAWEYVWQFKETQTLSLAQLQTEVFGKHWQDESWHEVLRLIVGLVESSFGGEIIEYLRSQSGESEKFANVFLAADCLSEVRNRSLIAATDSELLNEIKGLTKYDLPYSYEEYGDEADLVRKIRVKAVNGIAINWQDDLNTLPWLKEWVTNDDDSSVRLAAVIAIAEGWKDNPDTLPLLKEWVTNDDDSSVLYDAVKAIAQGWKDNPDTLPLLKERVTNDDDSWVRLAAVEAIAEGWKDEPGIYELLCHTAINDPFQRQKDWEKNPRQTALEAIIKYYRNLPQTLPLLRDRLENDSDEKVRKLARNTLKKWRKS